MQPYEPIGHLDEMDLNECEELLANQEGGRLAVVVAGRPEIFPVNYVLDAAGAIVIETAFGTKLAAAVNHHVVFEIDHIAEPGSGWSVIVHGFAQQTDVKSLQFNGRQPHPWVGGRSKTLRIHPDQISGRRLGLGTQA